MIQIKNIRKSIDDFVILDDVSVDIPEESFFTIIGKSGAGKSTLINCINRLVEVDSGQILVNGEDIVPYNEEQLRLLRKKMSMVFQNYPLVERRTVYQNIALPMEFWDYDKDEIDDKVNLLAKLVKMDDQLSKLPRELSGGQKQRVALARALTTDPEFLLCDEVTSALDPYNSEVIMDMLVDIKSRITMTIILVTHDIDIAKKYSDIVSVMESGKIIRTGSREEIFLDGENPITKAGASSNV